MTNEVQEDLNSMPEIEILTPEFSDFMTVEGDDLPPGLHPERPNLLGATLLEPGSKPVARPMYRLSQLERREVENQIRLNLESGRFKPSSFFGLHQ